MSKRFKVLSVKTHVWNVVKNVDNVVLLKCTCCRRQRIGVAIQREKERYYDDIRVTTTEYLFWYHGYDNNYAEQVFNELVQRQRNNKDDEEYHNEENNNDYKNHTISNNSGKKHNNDNNTLVIIDDIKITISNPYFHVRGEKQR